MFFDLYGLYQSIVNYDEIYVYGMGNYSEIIVPKLYDLGVKAKIAGYVLSTNELKEHSFKGIPVYSIEKLHIDASKSIFIIATSARYEHEIECKLKKCNYTNYVLLSSYEKDNYNVFFRFENTNYKQYCECISTWYEYKHSHRLKGNVIEEHKKICSEIRDGFEDKVLNSKVQNKNQIVFIVFALQPRIHKIIGALADKGYEIVVFNINSMDYPYSQYDVRKNVTVYYYECIEEVLYETISYTPLVFYVRPAYLDTSIANIMLMQKECYGKIILDIHDIAKGSYNLPPESQWMYEIEKNALESADGVVWRYDAEKFLREKYGYQYRGKSVQFWDYCYDEFIFDEPERDNILKLSCIDSNAECIKPSNDDELCKDGILRYANIFDVLHKIGNRDDCEFELFVSKISVENLKILKELKKEYFNFDFFIGYSPQMVIQKMSKSDYGCNLCHGGRIPTDEECIEKGYDRLAGAYMVSSTNRYFDFLNAGIPLVASYDGKKEIDFLKRYGVIVDMDLENFDIEYLQRNKKIYRENVKKAKKYLAISAQIDRLIDFFNSI